MKKQEVKSAMDFIVEKLTEKGVVNIKDVKVVQVNESTYKALTLKNM